MIGILGAGSWGTALAIVFSKSEDVILWHRDYKYAKNIDETRENSKYLPGITIPKNIYITNDLEDVLKKCKHIFIAIPSSYLDEVFNKITHLNPENIILCSKGFCAANSGFHTDYAATKFPNSNIAVISGPNFAAEVAMGKLTSTTLASHNIIFKNLAKSLSSENFKIVFSNDLKGVQLIGAVKNIYAIGAGIIKRNFDSENFMAAYITNVLSEIRELLDFYDADINTIFTPAGIGDLFLTCSSNNSRNFRYGYNLVDNISAIETVEGLYALKIITKILGNKITNFSVIDIINKIAFQNANISSIKDLL